MAYHSILVHLDHEPACAQRTEIALRLAREHGSRLIGLAPTGSVQIPIDVASSLFEPGYAIASGHYLRTRADGACAEFEARAKAAGVSSVEFRVDEADHAESVIAHAFGADLVIVGPDETPSQADVYADLMSLAGLFGTTTSTVPLADGYLAADPASQAAWSQRLGDRVKPRIGLVWSGAAGHANDRNRSASLAALAPLFAFDADWFVLQKDIRPADRETLAGLTSVTLIEEAVADFEQTAALIANLDLVIAVDTSIAHLAAAMGKPTWILLSPASDWRWLLEREDSPWYASARLFRQAVAHDWSELAERVRAELARRFA